MSWRREVKNVLSAVEAAEGWSYRMTKGGYMIHPPDKSLPPISVHMTMSRRNEENVRARLRRAGLVWRAKER